MNLHRSLLMLAALLLAACAATDRPMERDVALRLPADLAAPVDRVYLPRLDHWRPVDRQYLVLYQSPSRQYLVKLERPVTQLPFTDLTIGVRQDGAWLDSRFDSIIVDGWRYQIEEIRPLTKAQAEAIG